MKKMFAEINYLLRPYYCLIRGHEWDHFDLGRLDNDDRDCFRCCRRCEKSEALNQ